MIFSKRSVRRMLDALAPGLGPQRLKDIEGKLAKESDQTRPAEWEVAIAYALSQVGELKDFGNERAGNPDFIWFYEGTPLIVEVTCVSDASLHDQNPVNDFLQELNRIARKHRLTEFGRFTFEFGSAETNDKVLIAIPSKKDFGHFFKSQDFNNFLEKIKSAPSETHHFSFSVRSVISHISYLAGAGGYSGGGYRSYSVPQTYRHSPIYNCLQSKEKQLRRSGVTDPAILVICDNDCNAFSPSFGSNVGRVSMKDIVGLFLNGQQKRASGDFVWQEGVPAQGSRIHAVIWITVDHSSINPFSINRELRLTCNIEFATYAASHLKSPEFLKALDQAFRALPPPRNTPRSAATHYKYPCFYGGYEMSEKQIKLSALTLQKLLAGEISYTEFHRDHTDLVCHLKRLSEQGLTISDTQLIISENDDDDWVRIDFNNINPDSLFIRPKD